MSGQILFRTVEHLHTSSASGEKGIDQVVENIQTYPVLRDLSAIAACHLECYVSLLFLVGPVRS